MKYVIVQMYKYFDAVVIKLFGHELESDETFR